MTGTPGILLPRGQSESGAGAKLIASSNRTGSACRAPRSGGTVAFVHVCPAPALRTTLDSLDSYGFVLRSLPIQKEADKLSHISSPLSTKKSKK